MRSKMQKLLILLLLLLNVSMISVVFANSGEGSNNPFSLQSSSPTGGQKKVPIDTKIHLTFTKNVVNILVKENNENCFRLEDGESKEIPFDVIMADDQIEREKRKEIILVPKVQLSNGRAYKVIVTKDLMSKSGVALEADITLSFTTIPEKDSLSSITWILGGAILVIVIIFYVKRKR